MVAKMNRAALYSSCSFASVVLRPPRPPLRARTGCRHVRRQPLLPGLRGRRPSPLPVRRARRLCASSPPSVGLSHAANRHDHGGFPGAFERRVPTEVALGQVPLVLGCGGLGVSIQATSMAVLPSCGPDTRWRPRAGSSFRWRRSPGRPWHRDGIR